MPGNLLIDSNIVFSLLLGQNDYTSTEKLFDAIEEFNVKTYIADFSIFTILIHFSKRKEGIAAIKFLQMLKSSRNLSIYKFKEENLIELMDLKFDLDFDDKLHYYLAKKKNLQLVSYDADFDKTDLKRITPKEALEQLGID